MVLTTERQASGHTPGTTEFKLELCRRISTLSDSLHNSLGEAESVSYTLLIIEQWGLNLKYSTIVANHEDIPANQIR